MKRLVLVLLALHLSFACYAKDKKPLHPEILRIRKEIRQDGLDGIARNTEVTIDSILKVANVNLRAKGYTDLAIQIDYEWQHFYRRMLIERHLRGYRDIGDHHPLIQWLSTIYDKIEGALGVEICKSLHISDIKTINYTLPVVFKPCSFPMDTITIPRKAEYRKHFAKGDVYYGLVPVITWWAISIGCWTGTHGVGSFLCALAATGAEWAMGTIVAPHLSNYVFKTFCE